MITSIASARLSGKLAVQQCHLHWGSPKIDRRYLEWANIGKWLRGVLKLKLFSCVIDQSVGYAKTVRWFFSSFY